MQHLIAAMQASVRFYWYVSVLNFTYFAECSIFALNAIFFAIFTHHALGALGRKRIPIIDIRLAYNSVPKKIKSFAGCNFSLAILLAPWAKHGLYAMDWVWKKWHRIRTHQVHLMAKTISHHLKMTSFLCSFYFSTWLTKNSYILIYFRMGPYFRWPEYHIQSRDAMKLRAHRRRDCFVPTRPGDPCLCRPTPIDVFIILHLCLMIRGPLIFKRTTVHW